MSNPDNIHPVAPGPLESAQQPLRPGSYVALWLVSLIISIALLLAFVLLAPSLNANGISGRVFCFLLIPLGLSSAAFVFGAMRSYATAKGKQNGVAIDLGGPVVGAALVVIGGFYLVPQEGSFDVTVRVANTSGIPWSDGNVSLYVARYNSTQSISTSGDADFKGIPRELMGQHAKLVLSSSGVAPESFEVENLKPLLLVSAKESAGGPIKMVETASGSALTNTGSEGGR